MDAKEDWINRFISNVILEMAEDGEFRIGLSVKKTAKLLGINEAKMYEVVRTDSFPSIKIGKRKVIPIVPLLQWLEKEAWKNCN